MCGDWSDVYPIYSGSVTTTPAATTDVDLQGVRSDHVLHVSRTVSGGGSLIVWFQGSLDGITWYDIISNPQAVSYTGGAVYVSGIPARHIHVAIYTTSGTDTVTVSGASK